MARLHPRPIMAFPKQPIKALRMPRLTSWLVLVCAGAVAGSGALAAGEASGAPGRGEDHDRPLNLSIPREGTGRSHFGIGPQERPDLSQRRSDAFEPPGSGSASRGSGMPFGTSYEARRGMPGATAGGMGHGRR